MHYFLNLPVWKKLIIVFLTVGLIPMGVIGVESIMTSNDIITKQVSNQLSSVRQLKANAVERYFERVSKQIQTLAANSLVINGATRLPGAYQSFLNESEISQTTLEQQKKQVRQYYEDQFGKEYKKINGTAADINTLLSQLDDDSWAHQYAYISNNSHPLGEKHRQTLTDADDYSSYSMLHQALHPSLRGFLEQFGYYDIMIVDPKSGDIVYTVFKEIDFSTSLSTGPFADTSLGEAFKKAMAINDGSTRTVLTDFRPYTPSYSAPASFISTPIYNEGEVVGILIFQIPIDEINAIMSERAGMGETGESYLVGPDYLMRSDSFFNKEHHGVITSFKNPELGSTKTDVTQKAFAGESGILRTTNYQQMEVLSSYSLIKLGDFDWAIVAEQEVSETFAEVEGLISLTVLVGILCAILVTFVALWMSKLISKPINLVADAIEKTAKTGSFNHAVNYKNNDEVGQMAASFDGLLRSMSTMFNETNEVLKEVAQGGYDASIKTSYYGDMALLCDGVNNTVAEIRTAQLEQQKLGVMAEQKAQEAEELAKQAKEDADTANGIKQALDAANTSVMMADANNTIVYTNIALDQMMSAVEADLRKDLPQFNAQTLIGTNMDVFHKNPQHQKNLISGLKTSLDTQIEVGGRVFRLVANPIFREQERVGTTVEWEDRTDEVGIEREIDTAIAAAATGDFSNTLSLDEKDGFFLSLSTGLNKLLTTTQMTISDVNQVVESMSQGDLTQKITTDYDGLFGELKDNLNNTVDKLTGVVRHIGESSQSVLTGATEIEAGMHDLSRRTEDQAAALEESASSMNQMTESVTSNSSRAIQADDMAKDATQKATQGGEIIAETVTAMKSINDASNSIANIISVVEEIAFQTNLLALNAAVEAARAGEQGRGFAVVAAEVRQLAQRSSASSKEIKVLIQDSVDKVSIGSNLVAQSGETLNEIVSAVSMVGETISEIAKASQEQSTGIGQVNVAIGSMDDMTQQNSALVEEATAASSNMSTQSRSMADSARFFKT